MADEPKSPESDLAAPGSPATAAADAHSPTAQGDGASTDPVATPARSIAPAANGNGTGPKPSKTNKTEAVTALAGETGEGDKSGTDTKKPEPKAKPDAAAPVGAKRPAKESLSVVGELEARKFKFSQVLAQTPAWVASMVVHMVLLLVLALWVQELPRKDDDRELVIADLSDTELVEDLTNEIETLDSEVLQTDAAVVPDTTTMVATPVETPFMDAEAAELAIEPVDFATDVIPVPNLLANATGGITAGMKGVEGRGSKARAAMVKSGGGSAASEAAVAAGLKWLASVQLPDGSWSFDHTRVPARKGKGQNPGDLVAARNAATALALMPFLGAGQTHEEGNYKKTVTAGLSFLAKNMKPYQGIPGSLHEPGGSMYSHGIASIALCEAYAMTQDKKLLVPAQLSLNFIVYSQDPAGGGWNYTPRGAGDTSILGWQLMALKSGHLGYLQVPNITIKKANDFLNSVQAESGAFYGYRGPGKGPATTAVGLLCRMYLGWKKDHPAITKGVSYIAESGPSGDMYYNYYATQVMRHYGGEKWEAWNAKMRDKLVNAQVKDGIEQGSWFAGLNEGHGGDQGGRLYVTAMSTMILEVYYRHLPIYGDESVDQEFPD